MNVQNPLPRVTINAHENVKEVEKTVLSQIIVFFFISLKIDADEIHLSNIHHLTHLGPKHPGIRIRKCTNHSTIETIFTLFKNERLNVEIIAKRLGITVPSDQLFSTIINAMDKERDFLILERELRYFCRTGEITERKHDESPTPQPKGLISIADVIAHQQLREASSEDSTGQSGSDTELIRTVGVQSADIMERQEQITTPTNLDELVATRYRFSELIKGLREKTNNGALRLSVVEIGNLTKEILGLSFNTDILALARFTRALLKIRVIKKIADSKLASYKVIALGYNTEKNRVILRILGQHKNAAIVVPEVDPNSLAGKLIGLQRMVQELEKAKSEVDQVNQELNQINERIAQNSRSQDELGKIAEKIAELEAIRNEIMKAQTNLRGVPQHKRIVEERLAQLMTIISSPEYRSAADKLKQFEELAMSIK